MLSVTICVILWSCIIKIAHVKVFIKLGEITDYGKAYQR